MLFVDACKFGRIRDVQQAFVTPRTLVRGFLGACVRGRLDIAKWIADRFWLTLTDTRICNDDILCATCANGHLHIVEWFIWRFDGVGANDARRALHSACTNGHMETAHYLARHFGLTTSAQPHRLNHIGLTTTTRDDATFRSET